MNFNDHSKLKDQHALLSASKYHWLNDDSESLFQRFRRQYIPMMGTVLHELAEKRIRYGMKLTKSDKRLISFYLIDHGIPNHIFDEDYIMETLMPYVNDAIGYRMQPEQVLYFSENCFGTADSISFRDNYLRIHDLKTGETPAHIEQLEIYAALFCLEYNIKPGSIQMELRIYQSGEILVHEPTAEDILPIMDKIITFDHMLDKMKLGED